MIVLFYDRRNRRTVRSDQLCRTNVVAELIQGSSQEPPKSFGDLEPEVIWDVLGSAEFPGKLSWHALQVADLGYKSESCPAHRNWDLCCLQSDLVFLEVLDA